MGYNLNSRKRTHRSQRRGQFASRSLRSFAAISGPLIVGQTAEQSVSEKSVETTEGVAKRMEITPQVSRFLWKNLCLSGADPRMRAGLDSMFTLFGGMRATAGGGR